MWYGRFHIEDESGWKIQKEFTGTEGKAEMEVMLSWSDFADKKYPSHYMP